VQNIINPETPEYSVTALIVVAIGVIVKIVLGTYVKAKGEEVRSDSLIDSGEDARFDAIISAATLVAAIIYILFGVSLESWLSMAISLFIIKSGVGMLRGSISRVLGEKASFELIRNIKKTITEFPNVSGAYDLALNNYGPDRYTGSVHIEVPEDLPASELDTLTRKITQKVLEEYDVSLMGIGVYAVNNHDKKVKEIRDNVYSIARSIEHVLQTHGFYLDNDKKEIRFDAVVSFEAKSRLAVHDAIIAELKNAYPDYNFYVSLDIDFSGKN
jgi:divalent metal cation (Fe/Co/Zn/Cd) transporter